ncbi:Uncharacterised protein [Bordetella pertussis]|nr:Uncharacterised protein [Bordetella pertussis]CFO25780.1 Uncharacterised protein [Bordetella pertussis]CFO42973.1 Uncharacterised protein [Bordetella pertussis]CFP16810.1 Uncharacterised protein [Bordetella pertussis]CFP62651.1 Uncharacterised protein [Bordetella pertussis]
MVMSWPLRRASTGAAISKAVRNWLDTEPSTRTGPSTRMLPPPMRSGGYPACPRYSIPAPNWRRASTRSPMGRSCMRGTPDRR